LSRFVEQTNQLLEALGAAGRPSDTGELRAPARRRERPAQRTGPTDAFFSNLTADQLIELRDHGVTPAFVREMRELGFTDLSPDDLVEWRDHGVGLLVRHRGTVQKVAAELGVAYNTARNRLDDIVAALGGPAEREERPDRPDRLEVLNRLAAGEIDFAEAMRLLKG